MQIYKVIGLVIGFLISINLNALSISSKDYYLPYTAAVIHLKEKKLAKCNKCEVIILLNSLSIPALEAFDVPEYSLMDAFASAGYRVWGIDFIGEGKSSYPKVMQEFPPANGIYPLSLFQALVQLKQAIAYISKETGAASVTLLGWSWGSVVAASYASANPKQINHLILYGAMYESQLPAAAAAIFVQPYADVSGVFRNDLPAYQNIPWQIIKTHWRMMSASNRSIVTPQALTRVEQTYIQIDPHPILARSLRRPLGPLRDLFSIWHGHALYDANKITTPTLVIYGDLDIFADRGLYQHLTKVSVKQEVQIKNATHWLIYEKTRKQFIAKVLSFLR
jgi:pimeloyl-ACP methyl ester carboxylesterase